MAGAPIGNQNARRAAVFRDALLWAVENFDSADPRFAEGARVAKGQALNAIAIGLVRDAIARGHAARKELADRLEGKPPQQVIHSGDPDAPLGASISGMSPEAVDARIDEMATRLGYRRP